MVCAADREMAPQIIASQKWRRRSVDGSACLAVVAPPLMAHDGGCICSACIGCEWITRDDACDGW